MPLEAEGEGERKERVKSGKPSRGDSNEEKKRFINTFYVFVPSRQQTFLYFKRICQKKVRCPSFMIKVFFCDEEEEQQTGSTTAHTGREGGKFSK